MKCINRITSAAHTDAVAFLYTILVISFNLQVQAQQQSYEDFTPRFVQKTGLFPSVVNLASRSIISANATCGLHGEVTYCKLVEHVDRRAARRGRQCSLCNLNSIDPSEVHDIKYAIDGLGNKWWQSPTIEQGYGYHWVTITLDLKQVFQVAYIIIKAANSPRPGNWILEKSLDGNTWIPWQYFATSNSECYKEYGLQSSESGAPDFQSDTDVICTSYFSQLIPLENGEIHVSLINGRPTAENPSQELIDFTSARYIRLSLQRIRTLHGDLMTLSYSSSGYADPLLTRRYYYSIKDISIGGLCICNGHAENCPTDFDTELLSCQCKHNTAGHNCEVCARGFHQHEWQPGNTGFHCEACNCHGHADDCFYDPDVAERRESLDSHGEYSGGGVCIGCKRNTAGVNCETCSDGYYRPLETEVDAENPCVQCDCNSFGTVQVSTNSSLFACVKDATFVDTERSLFPGSCYCKEGYSGDMCDRCSPGYRGYPSCEPCPCNISGSVNAEQCEGRCVCKDNVIGYRCSECKLGYYNLQARNPSGCEACYCSGVTENCQPSDLKWFSVQTNQGWKVQGRRGRRMSLALINENWEESYVEHIDAAREVGTTMYYWLAPKAYLGEKVTSYGGVLRYTVSYDIPDRSVSLLVQDVDVILEGNGKTLLYNTQGMLLESKTEREVIVRLAPSSNGYGWVDDENLQAINKTDMMLVLQKIKRLLIRAVYSRNREVVYRIRDVTLDIASPTGNGKLAKSVEVCGCPPGHVGLSCERCKVGYWRMDNRCLPCNCNGHSNQCNQLNGVCENCQDSTMGANCEQCKPGYYGDAKWGTSSDCKRCSCPLAITSNNFSPTCDLDRRNGDIICLECPVGYTRKRCHICNIGYFGEPLIPGGSCQTCQCSGNSDSCDSINGTCFACQHHTSGNHCERCKTGYFGDAVEAKNCAACDCHPIGSLGGLCNQTSGQCQCTSKVLGRRCDECVENHYLSPDFGSCIPCNCNQIGSTTLQCSSEGVCQCKIGVTGRLCDSCEDGYFGLNEDGCSSCECAVANENCDPVSGKCFCPPYTQGSDCGQCQVDAYHWDPHEGCKSCNCSPIGTIPFSSCSNVTGRCTCKSKYYGLQCNQCRNGYFGYPNCQSCRCNSAGAQPTSCDGSKTCNCSNEGECFCKQNVVGRLCDRCQTGAFGLSTKNPLGCTSCYCSGVTNQCFQAPFVWGPPVSIDLAPVDVTHLIDSLYDLKNDFPQNIVAVEAAQAIGQKVDKYWRLPSQFSGDKSLSYGGNLALTFSYESEPSENVGFDAVVSVLLRGNEDSNQLFEFNQNITETKISQMSIFPMREFEWMFFGTNTSIPRAAFSQALKNIQYFLVKVSGSNINLPRLTEAYLDYAIPGMGGRGDAGSIYPSAIGLEQCDCPAGYVGLSCEECDSGYMRVQIEGSVARCELCLCNNRSSSCDMKTGYCLNCEGRFTGRQCETCIPGYYISGTTCLKCACPGTNASDNFSPTCYSDGADGIAGYTCNACLSGYEGKHCENCADGYYRNPSTHGIECVKCGCNVVGSLDAICDKVTGQCLCDSGARGRICDQCRDRHVISQSGCTECVGECYDRHLGEVKSLLNETISVDLHTLIPPPWGRLLAGINTTSQLQLYRDLVYKRLYYVKFRQRRIKSEIKSSIIEVESKLSYFNALSSGKISSLFEKTTVLEPQTSFCGERSLELSSSVNTWVPFTRLKRSSSFSTFNSVESLSRSIKRLLLRVRNSPSEEMIRKYRNASARINEIRDRDLSHFLGVAQRSLWLSMNISFNEMANYTARVAEIKESTSAKNLKLKDLCNMHFSKLNNTQEILSNISIAIATVQGMNKLNREFIKHYDEEESRVSNDSAHVEAVLKKVFKLLNRTKMNYHSGKMHMQSLRREKQMKSALGNMTEAIKWILRNEINPAPKDLMLLVKDAVEDHKWELHNTSLYFKSVYKNLSKYSWKETEATTRWTSIANRISQAKSSMQTVTKKYPTAVYQLDSNLTARVVTLFNKSTIFLRSLEDMKRTIVDDTAGLRLVRTEVKLSNRNKNHLNSKHTNIMDRLNKAISDFLPTNATVASQRQFGQTPLLRDLQESVSSLQQTYQRLDNANTHALKHIRTFAKANNSLSLLSETAVNLRTSTEKAKLAASRMKGASLLVTENISNIRKLIEDVRRKAASIRDVSVKSSGKCVMQYKPVITPAKTTEIVLNVVSNTPNSLLLYLAGKKNDYVAVELREHLASVTWNLGSGKGYVQNPLQIRSVGENDWFQIELTRKNQVMNVTVSQISNKSETLQTAQGMSLGNNTILDVDSTGVLYIGGIINKRHVIPNSLKYQNFSGCMGEAFLQGNSLGLFNFKQIQQKSDCKGCVSRGLRSFESNIYSFNGHSYTILKPRLKHHKNSTKVMLKFQTFSSEGLLLYMSSEVQPDFLSLELHDGYLVLKIDLGNGLHLGRSTKQYNKGDWVFAAVARHGSHAGLGVKVNDVFQEHVWVNVTSSTDKSLDLENIDLLCVGGLPPQHIVKSNVSKTSFVGCIKEFTFSGRLLTLKASGRRDVVMDTGVSYSCPAKITRNIHISNGGFVKLPSLDITAFGTVSVAFNTKSLEAIILLAKYEEKEERRNFHGNKSSYFSIYLSGGHIYATLLMNEGKVLTLSSRGHHYSNGIVHVIALRRNADNITLEVNDYVEDYVSDVVSDEATQAISVLHVFVGGVPDEFDVGQVAPVKTSLNGCIRDLMFENLIDFKSAIKTKNTYMGTCENTELGISSLKNDKPLAAINITEVLPLTQAYRSASALISPIKQKAIISSVSVSETKNKVCKGPGIFSHRNSSAHFGFTRNSYLRFALKTKVDKRFRFDLRLKTYGESGLILYLGHETKEDFFALKLKDGKPIFQFNNGYETVEAVSKKSINNGKWHMIRITRSKRHGWLIVNKHERTRVKSESEEKALDVSSDLFLGGLPKRHRSANAGITTNSLDMCLGGITFNKFTRLKPRKAKSSVNVQPCYKNFEPGAYFNGKGYIMYNRNYRVGPRMRIEVEIRTWKRASILMSVQSKRHDGLTLEIIDGTLVFRTDNGAGAFHISYNSSFVSTGGKTRYELCDGKWHKIRAEKNMNVLTLLVDGISVSDVIGGSRVFSADTSDPLYIGGMPDKNVPTKLLQTTQNFEGCMRNLVLKNTSISFDEIERHGVFPNSCPIGKKKRHV